MLVRKDETPENTIKKVQGILHKYNISVNETMICNNSSIYSCRLNINNTSIGTNGKGINEMYARASAYAEFMERLQTRYLLSSDNKKSSVSSIFDGTLYGNMSQNDIDNALNKFFPKVKNNSNLESACIADKWELYFDVDNSSLVKLPNSLIDLMCGSNGLCAGNTKYEAVCQGICENFERYALYMVFFEESKCPQIPKEYYKNLNSGKLVEFYEKQKYTVIIKDCTLGGKIPVLAAILISPDKRKMKLSIASDISMDIALQRCLTEMIQGKKLDPFFPYEMSLIYNENFGCKKISITYKEKEIIKSFVNGSGKIPYGFIIDQSPFEATNLNVFCESEMDNRQAYFKLRNILKNNKMKLFLKDYSIFDFPTYRVFIQNVSHIFLDYNERIKKHNLSSDLINYAGELRSDSFIEKLHQFNISSYEPNETQRMITRLLSDKTLLSAINDTKSLEIFLLYLNKRYEDCTKMIDLYYPKNNIYIYILNYIKAKSSDQDSEFIQFLNQIKDFKGIEQINNFIRTSEKLLDSNQMNYTVQSDDLLHLRKLIDKKIVQFEKTCKYEEFDEER